MHEAWIQKCKLSSMLTIFKIKLIDLEMILGNKGRSTENIIFQIE